MKKYINEKMNRFENDEYLMDNEIFDQLDDELGDINKRTNGGIDWMIHSMRN